MPKQTNSLKMGLLDNGSHSLKRGYEMWTQWKQSNDAWLLKESIIWVHHGIELLLKQLLVQTNEFLVFQDVNKAVERLGILRKKDGMKDAGVLDLFEHDDKAFSVGFRNLIDRTAITLSIDELAEREPLRKQVDQLTRYRNKIVHFSIELDVLEVSSLLSEILNPLLHLLSKEVNDQNFKEKVIPEIQQAACSVQKYVEFENTRKDILSLLGYIDTSQRSLNQIKQNCRVIYPRGIEKLLDLLYKSDFLETIKKSGSKMYKLRNEFHDEIPAINLGVFPEALESLIESIL